MQVSQRPWAAAGSELAASSRGAQDLGVVATFTMEPDGRVSSWSAAAGRLLGHQAQQILGRPVRDLLDPGSRNALATALTAISAGAAWTGVLTARGANGTGQHISFRLEPLTCVGAPQVAVTASPPVPAGQQMLIDAGLRFGATLDLAETARQIIDVTVPRFADACAVNNEYACGIDEESVRALPGSSIERGRKVIGGLDILDLQRHPQRAGRFLHCLHL